MLCQEAQAIKVCIHFAFYKPRISAKKGSGNNQPLPQLYFIMNFVFFY
jgi:hypothetical protein